MLGSYVVEMLQGKLNEEASTRWAWDRKGGSAARETYIPRRDLKDIAGYAAICQENGIDRND